MFIQTKRPPASFCDCAFVYRRRSIFLGSRRSLPEHTASTWDRLGRHVVCWLVYSPRGLSSTTLWEGWKKEITIVTAERPQQRIVFQDFRKPPILGWRFIYLTGLRSEQGQPPWYIHRDVGNNEKKKTLRIVQGEAKPSDPREIRYYEVCTDSKSHFPDRSGKISRRVVAEIDKGDGTTRTRRNVKGKKSKKKQSTLDRTNMCIKANPPLSSNKKATLFVIPKERNSHKTRSTTDPVRGR